jgi:hypothetical protein
MTSSVLAFRMPVGIPFFILLRLSKTSRTRDRQAYKIGKSYCDRVKSAFLRQCRPVTVARKSYCDPVKSASLRQCRPVTVARMQQFF